MTNGPGNTVAPAPDAVRCLPDLSGAVALITGAGGGIGGGIATQFAAAGAAVALHYRTSPEPAKALADSISARGGRAVAVQADITDPAGVAGLIETVVAEFGRIDALVNNAGVQPVQDLVDMSIADWREVVDTNVTGTVAVTQAAAAAMRNTDGGSITHIASIEGSHPARSHAHYCASKAALIMFARSAALEYGTLGIRVNTVSPGLIDRDGLAEAWPDGVRRFVAAAPLGRLGRAADVGNACVFLASPMGSWITGTDLMVDGGVSVHPTW